MICSNDWDGPLLIRRDIAINFYVGGLLAVRQWQPTALLAWLAYRVLDRIAPAFLGVVTGREARTSRVPDATPAHDALASTRPGADKSGRL